MPSPYLVFKVVQPCQGGFKIVQPCQALIWVSRLSNRAKSSLFQNYSRCIHTLGLIVLGNPPRPLSSSQYILANINSLLVSDFCHLISTPWPIPMKMKVYPCHLANTPWPLPMNMKVDPRHLASASWLILINMKVYLHYLASKPWPLPMNIKVDPCHLASTPWLLPMTRLTTSQRRKSGCVQPTAHSLPLSDAQKW